jgi:3-oxoacyl-[acyl-carrier protein] reductase
VLIDIAKKIVVITGAGRGIGAGLARRFAAEGCVLALLERDKETLSAVASELALQNATVEAIHCDVSQPTQVDEAFSKIASVFGTVHVLINNAGVAPSAPLENTSIELWEDTFANNTRSVFLCCKAAIPLMKAQRWGRILNSSSFAAIVPSYGFSAYAASKAALVSLTRVFAAELGPWGITVNAYAPGMVPTRLSRFAEASARRQTELLDTLAIRRWETPDDLASLLIFLASDHAAYITGTLLDVSGGKFSVQFPQLAHAAWDAETSAKS